MTQPTSLSLYLRLQAQHVLFMVSGVFYYFNSILNPILYSIMSKRFRRGFNDICGNCKLLKVRLVGELFNVDFTYDVTRLPGTQRSPVRRWPSLTWSTWLKKNPGEI